VECQFPDEGSKVKVTGRQKPPQQSGVMFTYSRPIERPLLRRRLQGGRGLEFPSIMQPVAAGRTVAYHVGADVFAVLDVFTNADADCRDLDTSDVCITSDVQQ